MVKKIAKEKELADQEIKQLISFVQRRSPGHPLWAITVRQHFDHCIEQEMEALRAGGHTKEYEEAGSQLRDIRLRLGLDYIPFGQRILSTRELHMGQSVWLPTSSETPPHWMRTDVSGLDEAYFYLRLPDLAALEKPKFKPGNEVECQMWREDDGRYTFRAALIRFDTAPATLVFRHTSQLSRIQSRAHFRIRHNQPVSLGILNAPANGSEEGIAERPVVTHLHGRITNLSAGGLALITQQPIPRHVFLRLTLELPETEPVEVNGRIVSATPLPNGQHLVRIAYLGLAEEMREKIAKHVLRHQQLNLLSTEKGRE
jgi:hypothetical protein